jgi:hypothetical protein
MADIGTVADSLAAWLKPLVRRAFVTFAKTAFGLSLLSIGIAVGGYLIASPPSALRGVLTVLVAFGCFVAFGIPLMIKRAIGAVVREGIVKLGLGTKVSHVLFKRMSESNSGAGGSAAAESAAGPVPLSQATSQLQRAIETVQRVSKDERFGFFRAKIQAVVLALVGKVTNTRFREVAAKLGTVDVAAVKQQLSGDIDQRIVAMVNKTLWRTTAMALLLCCGVPLVFALLMRSL